MVDDVFAFVQHLLDCVTAHFEASFHETPQRSLPSHPTMHDESDDEDLTEFFLRTFRDSRSTSTAHSTRGRIEVERPVEYRADHLACDIGHNSGPFGDVAERVDGAVDEQWFFMDASAIASSSSGAAAAEAAATNEAAASSPMATLLRLLDEFDASPPAACGVRNLEQVNAPAIPGSPCGEKNQDEAHEDDRTESQKIIDMLEPETDSQIERANKQNKAVAHAALATSSRAHAPGPRLQQRLLSDKRPRQHRGVIWTYMLRPHCSPTSLSDDELCGRCHAVIVRTGLYTKTLHIKPFVSTYRFS